jgi:hypothetical protein
MVFQLFLSIRILNVKLLLEFGADINIKNARRDTILTYSLSPDFTLFIEGEFFLYLKKIEN